MSSTYSYTISPASLHEHPSDRVPEPHHTDTHDANLNHPVTPQDPQQLLSPYSSHIRSNSTSPTGYSNTPAESISTLSLYQPSDFGSDYDDPFFGIDFNDTEGVTPSFLDDQVSAPSDAAQIWSQEQTGDLSYGQSSSPFPQYPPSFDRSTSAPQLTPDTNEESFSSEDSLAASGRSMASPRVMVSEWGKDGANPIHYEDPPLAPGMRGALDLPEINDDAISTETVRGSLPSVTPEPFGNWKPDTVMERRGLAPDNRPSGETLSVNQLAAARQVDERNQDVAAWVSDAVEQTTHLPEGGSNDSSASISPGDDDNIPNDDVPLGHMTENRLIPGQVYYNTEPSGGVATNGMTRADLDIIAPRNWGDGPMIHPISQIGIDAIRDQPESSQAAIEKFERMCQDNDSVISHAATWGTRRRSLPSIMDVEGIISGSFLKKLSIKVDSSSRRPSLLRKIPSMVRRPSASQLLKRKGGNTDEAPQPESVPNHRRESRDSLAPPSRASSWGIKQKQMPSINTAIVGIATGAATIGTSHARSGSISATSMNSPKSPFGLAPVKNTLRRPRSKTELPRTELSHPHIVGMLRQAGGPPVAQLAKSYPASDQDDDDDEDDEGLDDSDMKMESGRPEDIEPTVNGFQQHIIRLNPVLANTNGYLVERMAHQMVVRYKNLQSVKVKHLKAAHSGKCVCGPLCIEQGGAAAPLDKGDGRAVDPLSARPDSSDGDTTPLEGGINTESFPPGIPMPPTTALPAEFECQLCFTSRKFVKPSDWTKHVHEDVQPFTCTWDRCRDPKMFKRKADWVRHENEGHRHLEWWTCDVEDCRHTCYRRDNFLQHLVREHKFAEPKVKTKAAIKKAGGSDLTWQKVEKCHTETQNLPQDEPCRFCGKFFPTWKKLTVHLAKHMEHISLPVLRLVSAKDLTEDTIISPVQDPPPRSFGALPLPAKQEPPLYSPQRPHAFSNPSPVDFSSQNPYVMQGMGRNQMSPQFYNQHQPNDHFDINHGQAGGLMMPQGFNPQQQYHPLPVTNAPSYGQPANPYMAMQPPLEPFPTFNPLGLQDPSGGPLSYDALADPNLQNVEQYSNQGSVSPYSHSPHLNPSNFYNH